MVYLQIYAILEISKVAILFCLVFVFTLVFVFVLVVTVITVCYWWIVSAKGAVNGIEHQG